MLFDSYFQWIIFTCLCLALFPSNYSSIIYKSHPHAHLFRDQWLLKGLGLLLAVGVNRKKVILINSESNLDPSIGSLDSGNLTPVTVHGSIAFEAASFGVGTITCGASALSAGSVVSPSSISDYLSLLTDSSRTESVSHLDSTLILQANKVLALAAATRLPSSPRKLLSMLEEAFYFGTVRTFSHSKISTTIAAVQASLSPISYRHSNGDSLICYLE